MRKVVRLFPVFRIRADVDFWAHAETQYIDAFDVCEPLRHHSCPFYKVFTSVSRFCIYDEWNAAKSTNVPRNFALNRAGSDAK